MTPGGILGGQSGRFNNTCVTLFVLGHIASQVQECKFQVLSLGKFEALFYYPLIY